MALLEDQLVIKKSNIPDAGMGLFTKKFIAKGTTIVEYKGRITTWKEVQQSKKFNAYVYYITRNHVVDGMNYKKSFARYANDAGGLTKIKGLRNNTTFVNKNKRVFVEALRDIEAGAEIFVAYGKEYWDVMRYNMKIEKKSGVGSRKTEVGKSGRP